MPYIFISAVALCANLYRCAPLIVGDKYADPELMKFLGAKITTDYPEPNSPPMYVMFATMRSVLDALQEIGYELNSSHMVQGYTTWILSKPVEGDTKGLASASDGAIGPENSITSEIESEPEARASKPRRSKHRMKDKGVETVPQHFHERLPTAESEYARDDRQRRPVSDVDESTSTRDLPSSSSRRLLGLEEAPSKEPSKRQGMKQEEPSKERVQQPKDLEPKDSQMSGKQEPEEKVEASESETPSHTRKLKGRGSSDSMPPHEKNSKHKGTKGVRRKSSNMSTPVKENFKD